MDWVTAASDAGYKAVTGVVEYCLKSLPLDQQLPEIQSCEGPALCHDAFPSDVAQMVNPWRALDGLTWTEPADEGLLIVNAAGPLPCESQPGATATCDFQIIEEALAARQPGQFHALFFIRSYGSPMQEDVLTTFYEGLMPYIERGDVVWQTMPELIEAYEAFEQNPH